jgi:hypothetical protein
LFVDFRISRRSSSIVPYPNNEVPVPPFGISESAIAYCLVAAARARRKAKQRVQLQYNRKSTYWIVASLVGRRFMAKTNVLRRDTVKICGRMDIGVEI